MKKGKQREGEREKVRVLVVLGYYWETLFRGGRTQ